MPLKPQNMKLEGSRRVQELKTKLLKIKTIRDKKLNAEIEVAKKKYAALTLGELLQLRQRYIAGIIRLTKAEKITLKIILRENISAIQKLIKIPKK